MKKRFIIHIIIIIFTLFYLFLIDNFPIIGGDQTQYILLGKSISSGLGYTEIWFPNNNIRTQFPFLYPVILSPLIYLFGYNFCMIKLLNLVFAILSMIVVYFLLKSQTNNLIVVSILILTGISCRFIYYILHAYSDISYLLFSLLSLFFIQKYYKENKIYLITSIFTSFFILCAYFTRSIGATLIITVIIYLFFERQDKPKISLQIKKIIILISIISIPIILWSFWNWNYSLRKIKGFSYLSSYLFMQDPFNINIQLRLFEVVLRNIYAYIFYAFPSIITGIEFQYRIYVNFFITSVFFSGFVYCLLRKRCIFEYYVIIYMLSLLFYSWSSMSGIRFIVPLIPFIFYYFIIGCMQIFKFIRIRSFKFNPIIVVILLLIFSNIINLVPFINKKKYRDYSEKQVEDFFVIAKWVKNNTDRNKIFAGINPSDIYLYFDRKSVYIPSSLITSDKLVTYIIENKIDYFFYSSLYSLVTVNFFKPVITQKINGIKFSEVYRKNKDVIYKISKS